MNRRQLLTAIPAVVAALVGSKLLAGVTSPVVSSEAIVGPYSTGIRGYAHGINTYVAPSDGTHTLADLYHEQALGMLEFAREITASTDEIARLTDSIEAMVAVLEAE